GATFSGAVQFNAAVQDHTGSAGSNTYVLTSTGSQVLWAPAGGTSFNSRSGAVIPLSGDYSAFYLPVATVLPANTPAVSNQFLTSYSGSGAFGQAAASFAGLTGSIATGQIPAGTVT